MRKQKRILTFILMLCLMLTGILITSDTAYAGSITSISQAERLALMKVKRAGVIEVDKDYEKGMLAYRIHLWKGTREYELIYRASDAALLSYSWEEIRINRTSRKKIMSRNTCRRLALQKVSKGKVVSLTKKYDDGIYRYKAKLQKGDKRYSLEYHARTGKLLEYKWELKSFQGKNKYSYIGWRKAKRIARSRMPGAEVVRVEIRREDGPPVYEVELIKDGFEYEIEIHARTGKVLTTERNAPGLKDSAGRREVS